ncbi:efflux RND transporter permease subunit [Candidatus Ruminimicrobium bovinum]|uniref:efflux RND transporter permease subunit n=1 Tax=Candidatus Ruminimicrobium bovinum TaxID=3242779 RepID=UPI0039B84FB9
MSILRLPVDRPVTTIMIFCSVILMGVIAFSRIPQELFPAVEYPQITIVTKYEGAGPEESEKLITKIIEESAGTVKKIKRITSTSKEGVSIVSCEFLWGTNMDFASMNIREKIDLIKESLPKDALEPVVLKYNPMQVEAIILSANYKTPETSLERMAELRTFVKKNIKDELERIEGVAKVEIRGGEQKEILVEIDKGRLLANQVSINDVVNSLQTANITYPAGTIKEEKHEYIVKTVGEFKNLDDIEALSFGKQQQQEQKNRYRKDRTVQSGNDEKIVYMRDVADVKEILKDKKGYSRYNSRENVSIGIFPQSGANLINMSKNVKAKLKDLADKIPPDVEIETTYDQSIFIKKSLNNIYESAIQGMLLSFILLYFFMKSFVGSSIINTAIPISLCVTLSIMYFQGITINSMSLGGLTIGIGMVVDNGNMVLENILMAINRNKTLPKKEAIYKATSSLLPPILSSTLTTVSIFIPFIFVAGMIGQLFSQLALTITFSMIASIFAAMFLVPRLCLSANLAKQSVTAGVHAINTYFTPTLKSVLNMKPLTVFLVIFCYGLVGFFVTYLIPKEFMPKTDERRFVLNLSMHPDTPLEITNSVVKRIEQAISKYDEVLDIATTIGSTDDQVGSASVETLDKYQARIITNLKPKGMSTNEMVKELSDEIKKWNIKNIDVEFVTQQGLFGSGVGSSAGVVVEIKGKDLDKLKEYATKLRRQMDAMPEFYGIKVDPSDEIPELKLNIDRERASLFGLSTQDISAMTLAAIKGYVATKLKLPDDEIDIRVRMQESDRDTLDKVLEMTAYSSWGMTIQLKQIAQSAFVKTLPTIKRIERERTYMISANVNGNFTKAVSELQVLIDDAYNNKDVSTIITGEMLAMKESLSQTGFAMILGVIIIYMILASQFESLLQPILVMTAVPLGIIGALITLYITGQSINSISMLGLIMLIGNVVNISILLIDRYNIKYLENPDKYVDIVAFKQMVTDTTADHIRPIVMTTLTTVVGLVPLALGLGEGATTNQPMAIAVVGGLIFALALALLFVPYIYLFAKGVRNSSEDEFIY